MPKLAASDSTPRLYRAGSVWVPSVTSVLRFLEDSTWVNAYIARHGRAGLDARKSSAAALGTRIHAVADRVARDRLHDPGTELLPYAQAIREFYDRHVRRVIETELSLVSAKERVGGTLDAYVELMSGDKAVVDIKCKRAAGITDVNRVQTAGYALLLREHGYEVNRRIVLRLHTSDDKRGRWYARNAPDHAGDVKAFRACVELWHFRHGNKLLKKAEVA